MPKIGAHNPLKRRVFYCKMSVEQINYINQPPVIVEQLNQFSDQAEIAPECPTNFDLEVRGQTLVGLGEERKYTIVTPDQYEVVKVYFNPGDGKFIETSDFWLNEYWRQREDGSYETIRERRFDISHLFGSLGDFEPKVAFAIEDAKGRGGIYRYLCSYPEDETRVFDRYNLQVVDFSDPNGDPRQIYPITSEVGNNQLVIDTVHLTGRELELGGVYMPTGPRFEGRGGIDNWNYHSDLAGYMIYSPQSIWGRIEVAGDINPLDDDPNFVSYNYGSSWFGGLFTPQVGERVSSVTYEVFAPQDLYINGQRVDEPNPAVTRHLFNQNVSPFIYVYARPFEIVVPEPAPMPIILVPKSEVIVVQQNNSPVSNELNVDVDTGRNSVSGSGEGLYYVENGQEKWLRARQLKDGEFALKLPGGVTIYSQDSWQEQWEGTKKTALSDNV